jgi:hypothetical protein
MSMRPPWDQEHEAKEAGRRARGRRDAGLRKVSRLTGWALAGTLGLIGGLTEVAAHAQPGHKKPVRTARTSRPAPATTSETQHHAPTVIQPPEQVPVPSDSGAGAVSGGS